MTRRLLCLVGLLLLAPVLAIPASAAISVVASGGSANDTDDNSTTDAADTTGATLLVITVSWYNAITANVTCSDSKSNTWTGLTARVEGDGTVQIFYVNSVTPTVGTGHTFQCNGTSTFPNTTFVAASGTAASPFDQLAGNNSSSATSINAGSVTPTSSGQLIVTALIHSVSGVTDHMIGSGFTVVFEASFAASAYLVQGAAATVDPLWEWTGTDDVASTIATFKAAAAGGGGPCAVRMLLLGVGGGC